MTRIASACTLVLALLLSAPVDAAGQRPVTDDPTPAWVHSVGWAGANALIGGVTAGIGALIGGHPPGPAFLKGAAGGGVAYLGKVVAGSGHGLSGLVGRQVAALGSNVVADGGRGRPLLQEIWLPAGPAWLQVGPARPFDVRLELIGLAVTGWALLSDDLRLDPDASLRTGALVFSGESGGLGFNAGFAAGGVVAITAPGVEDILAHESIHVLQQDMVLLSVTRPLEASLFRSMLGRELGMDLGLGSLLLINGGALRFIEAEAERLTGH